MLKNNIEYYDIFSLLEGRYEMILDNLSKADNIALRLLDSNEQDIHYSELKILMDSVYQDIHLTLKLEENYLYPELRNILPEQTSIDALAEEHKLISALISSIKINLENKEVYFCNTYKVQSEIIGLYHIMQRNIHKKET